MLQHNDVISHVELNESSLEYFLKAKYGSSFVEPNFNELVQILSFKEINIDEEVQKVQAVALSINIDEENDSY